MGRGRVRGSSGLRVGARHVEGAKVVGAAAVRDSINEDGGKGCRQHESEVVPRAFLDRVGEAEAPHGLPSGRHVAACVALAQPHPRGDLPIISAVHAKREARLGASKLDDGHAWLGLGLGLGLRLG